MDVRWKQSGMTDLSEARAQLASGGTARRCFNKLWIRSFPALDV